MSQLYDEIGVGYRDFRRPDPRLEAAITRALNQAETVVNVGAGTGSYEPSDRSVVAVEPAMTMLRQRRPGSAPVVQASATELPFRDDGFAVALAILTVHHWPDQARGLDEMARVVRRRVVVVTWDPSTSGFWLTDDYFPEIVEIDRPLFPSIEDFRKALGRVEVHPLPIPHDCADGFLGAYWRRPSAPTGGGRTRIWMRACAARSPHSRSSTIRDADSTDSVAILKTARGPAVTEISWINRRSISATGS